MTLKKIVLAATEILGATLTCGVAVSGVAGYLLRGPGEALQDPVIIWYAPLFFTPLALIGLTLISTGALVSRIRRRQLAWSVLAVVVLFAATAAVFNLSGLSTGEIEVRGTLWGSVAVVTSLAYALSLLPPACVGILVANDILRSRTHKAVSAD
jgi:hypothetical protein